jgi:hypothetical protein
MTRRKRGAGKASGGPSFELIVVGLGGVVAGYFLAHYLAGQSSAATATVPAATAGYLAGPGRRRRGGGGGGSQPQGASMFTPAGDGSDVSFDDSPSFDEGY